MLIQYCSDLHLEFSRNQEYLFKHPILPMADTLILAGDIMPFAQIDKASYFLDYLNDHFKTTYWIPGNHEYYHYNLAHCSGRFEQNIRKNVILINDSAVMLDNNLFVFSTLWSSIDKQNENEIERRMNDYRLINVDGHRFTASHSNQLHRDSVRMIHSALIQDTETANKVVITHHLPTFFNYPLEYSGDALNQGFATNLDQLILQTKPDYWIFGYHHCNVEEFTIGNTRMLTNQLGYVQYNEHLDFRTDRVIEI